MTNKQVDTLCMVNIGDHENGPVRAIQYRITEHVSEIYDYVS